MNRLVLAALLAACRSKDTAPKVDTGFSSTMFSLAEHDVAAVMLGGAARERLQKDLAQIDRTPDRALCARFGLTRGRRP